MATEQPKSDKVNSEVNVPIVNHIVLIFDENCRSKNRFSPL